MDWQKWQDDITARYPWHDDRRPTKRRGAIVTEHVFPPIPERCCDWAAMRDNYDGAPDSHCLIGRGATREMAIQDLLDQEAGEE